MTLKRFTPVLITIAIITILYFYLDIRLSVSIEFNNSESHAPHLNITSNEITSSLSDSESGSSSESLSSSEEVVEVLPDPLDSYDSNYHGVVSFFPQSGPIEGGNSVTFFYACANQTICQIYQSAFEGCLFDDVLVPVNNTLYNPMGICYWVTCIAPPHLAGKVKVAIKTKGVMKTPQVSETRLYTYSSSDYPSPKHKLAICTVAVNNSLFIREWIAFHKLFGVTKFYIYDHGGKNWTSKISDYIEDGTVVVVNWVTWMKPSARHQAIGFWHCLKTYGHEVEWMAFLDIDEFMFTLPPNNNPNIKEPSLPEFLKDYAPHGGLVVDRLTFAHNGHIKRPKGLVIENYTTRENVVPSNQPVKSIVRPSMVLDQGCGGVHTFVVYDSILNNKTTGIDSNKKNRKDWCGIPYEDTAIDKIRINHYWTKSIEDWMERYNLDSNPYKQVNPNTVIAWPWFTINDTALVRYADQIRGEVNKL